MKVLWSPRAESLLDDIVIGIATALSVDDALRWECDLQAAAANLGAFPLVGSVVPVECFEAIPVNADRLRQTFCGPYRIVYELVGDDIHFLSIRHSRMLVSEGDTAWS